MMRRQSAAWAFIPAMALALAAGAPPASAQIGGQVGGTKVIDDVEDLNRNAAGVDRNWISDFTFIQDALTPLAPETKGLALAPGQSPLGVFELKANNDFAGFFNMSAGVPVPSEKGQSTLTHPGDMTSFETLSFFACVDPSVANMQVLVILECYPQNGDGTFPELLWRTVPAVGKQFQPIELVLREPDEVRNGFGRTPEELLSQTRFLAFFLTAGQSFMRPEINLYFDDITLQGPPPASLGDDWMLYD